MVWKGIQKSLAGILVLTAVEADASFALEAAPTEEVKSVVARVVEVFQDPKIRDGLRKKEKRERLRLVFLSGFDFGETAKRALGADWRRYPGRQKEFVSVYTDFVTDSLVAICDVYRFKKVVYTQERIEMPFSQVDTKTIIDRGTEIPIHYRLHVSQGKWKLYDVHIENVSLVNYSRSQFHRILSRGSFDDLLKVLRVKEVKGFEPPRMEPHRIWPYLFLAATSTPRP